MLMGAVCALALGCDANAAEDADAKSPVVVRDLRVETVSCWVAASPTPQTCARKLFSPFPQKTRRRSTTFKATLQLSDGSEVWVREQDLIVDRAGKGLTPVNGRAAPQVGAGRNLDR
ncbi:MAG: hypothetical protein KKB47_06775 [Alphaproteobacteria bacterium]|nr:hypothetical protein [Alphaproteobacteria bacterium]MBU2307308.1 hypothetical protein [Alphaproteobacteria bacterium]MBU2362544.1 hypothetical protein [Alphaproteobacteria bacterium]